MWIVNLRPTSRTRLSFWHNDVQSIESQTLNGVATVKVYLHPQVRIDAATAQINSGVNGIRLRMPPGINPPWSNGRPRSCAILITSRENRT
jgi:multidrug efflux pump subunit AcrB